MFFSININDKEIYIYIYIYIYMGDTRSIKKRIYEHMRDFKNGDDINALVKHNLETTRSFDF